MANALSVLRHCPWMTKVVLGVIPRFRLTDVALAEFRAFSSIQPRITLCMPVQSLRATEMLIICHNAKTPDEFLYESNALPSVMSEDSALHKVPGLSGHTHGQDLPCPQTDAVPGELAQQGNPVLSTLPEHDSDLTRRSKDPSEKVAAGVGATAAPAAEDSMPTTGGTRGKWLTTEVLHHLATRS